MTCWGDTHNVIAYCSLISAYDKGGQRKEGGRRSFRCRRLG